MWLFQPWWQEGGYSSDRHRGYETPVKGTRGPSHASISPMRNEKFPDVPVRKCTL